MDTQTTVTGWLWLIELEQQTWKHYVPFNFVEEEEEEEEEFQFVSDNDRKVATTLVVL